MRIPRAQTFIFGLAALAVLLAVGYVVSRPRGPVLVEADVSLDRITPNADGQEDVTRISYRLRRQANVSIYFEGEDGTRYYYRQNEPRVRGEYEVLFSGVVDGFTLEGEEVSGEVLRRLLPDGEYRWVVEATDVLTGRVDRIEGTLVITDSDSILPDLWDFTVSPEVFTPNQDGIDDQIWINVYVPKEADLTVYLIDDAGTRYYVPESQQDRAPGKGGRHIFQWDGGVDMGKDPPPDGTYTVLVEAKDAEGQMVRHKSEVTIRFGGVPLAEIVGQPVGDTVRFSSETVLQGDVLTFELTVENYGDSPIRTTGPEPGFIYEQDETYATSGYQVESGAWRVGIHCDTCTVDFPWRWALGSQENLTPIESGGQTHYYLMPGERAVVTGGIRLTNIVEARNPQEFWAGLIHEDVGVATVNQRVDPHWIRIEPVESEAAESTP
ncbi:MAG: hypothetical protein WBH90_10260 [Aggregatilineales bacterium]|nr:hypothetical protein [Chloroflexota bacterium]HOA24688.1 hypothetical protein [Aggregatilineales bacterium]HPV08196.1 hypothetical protein [Aggregatilineales bacterium]HQE18474.1 hypothetical protein [Aggregatilineales bacterium]